MKRTILVTGAVGFIGFYLCKQLLENEEHVIGIDNCNDYYDVRLKEERLRMLKEYSDFSFIHLNIADKRALEKILDMYRPIAVVNLAAQAGVRYSIENPDVYIESNLVGFYNVLEACRHYPVEHLIYASSSSVYGESAIIPFSTDDFTDSPVSLYAATKKSDEMMAYCYSKLYDIPTTGLRFFTVYGPMGRPDMAYFSFANKLRAEEKIEIYNHGHCKRDFTYIDDVVDGIMRVIEKPPVRLEGADGLPVAPYAIYNIGKGEPDNLLEFVSILQQELVRARVLPEDYDFEAHKEYVPMQRGDVPVTYADTRPLEKDFAYKPSTTLREGLRSFARWYAEFYIKEMADDRRKANNVEGKGEAK